MAELEELASFLVSPRPEVSRPTSNRVVRYYPASAANPFLSDITFNQPSDTTGNWSCKVQRAAVEIVAGLTGAEEGLEKLRSHTKLIASALLPLLPSNKASTKNFVVQYLLCRLTRYLRSMHWHPTVALLVFKQYSA